MNLTTCENCTDHGFYIEMCADCWEKVPHTQSFDICSKCLSQCEHIDWSEWNGDVADGS